VRTNDSIKTSCDLQISVDFNKLQNRVRDQGVAELMAENLPPGIYEMASRLHLAQGRPAKYLRSMERVFDSALRKIARKHCQP